jgi:hypothetical protein
VLRLLPLLLRIPLQLLLERLQNFVRLTQSKEASRLFEVQAVGENERTGRLGVRTESAACSSLDVGDHASTQLPSILAKEAYVGWRRIVILTGVRRWFRSGVCRLVVVPWGAGLRGVPCADSTWCEGEV